jgi:hypothetical protein
MGDLPKKKKQRFFEWPNSHERPAHVEKFSKAFSILGHFKVASLFL